MLEIREKIRTSKGYQVLIEMLDSYFGQDYIIRKITYDDLDPTSFDFRLAKSTNRNFSSLCRLSVN